jgi:hypothetical protein
MSIGKLPLQERTTWPAATGQYTGRLNRSYTWWVPSAGTKRLIPGSPRDSR